MLQILKAIFVVLGKIILVILSSEPDNKSRIDDAPGDGLGNVYMDGKVVSKQEALDAIARGEDYDSFYR
ncbi:MAG: hypothetical protein K2W88_03895 [Pararheinheimera sp.]|nr:hypothetical protein [Rheinheimera sp.]